jgi:hypothetical protein
VMYRLTRGDKRRDHLPALRIEGELHGVETLPSAQLLTPLVAIPDAGERGTLGQRIENKV